MSTWLLLDDLRTRLKEGFEGFTFRRSVDGKPVDDEGEALYATPDVWIGQIPAPKGSRPTGAKAEVEPVRNRSPFLVIRVTQSTLVNTLSDTLDFKDVSTVAIICGIYSVEAFDLDAHGHQDIINMVERTKMILAESLTWAKRFRRRGPITTTYGLPSSIDPYAVGLQVEAPFYGAVLTSEFETQGALINFAKEGAH